MANTSVHPLNLQVLWYSSVVEALIVFQNPLCAVVQLHPCWILSRHFHSGSIIHFCSNNILHLAEKYFQLRIYNEQKWRVWQIIRSISRLTFLLVPVSSVLGFWQMSLSPTHRVKMLCYDNFQDILFNRRTCLCLISRESVEKFTSVKCVQCCYVCQHKIEIILSCFIKHLYFVVFLFKMKYWATFYFLSRDKNFPFVLIFSSLKRALKTYKSRKIRL